LGVERRRRLFEAFLAGETGLATAIYRFLLDALPGRSNRKGEAHLAAHIDIGKLSRKVRQEAHRMKGFVRFEQTADDRYLALVAPRYDVLPLVRRHFEKRFADQAWIIYDTQRNYGLCYDRHRTRELTLDANELKTIRSDPSASERLSQTLWQRYFAAVNIAQRANPRLHLSKLPRRYWRYLTEKKKG
jgi:probable DNA metabolism protein